MSNSKLNAKYQLPPPSAWTLLRVMHLSQKKGGGYKPIRNKASAKGPVFIATKFYAKSKLLPDKPTVWTLLVPTIFAFSAPPQEDEENQDGVLRRQLPAPRTPMKPVLAHFTSKAVTSDSGLVAVRLPQLVAAPAASIPGTSIPDVSSVAAVLVCPRPQNAYRKAHKAYHRKQRKLFKASEVALVEHLKAKEAARLRKLALLVKQQSAQQVQIEKNAGVANSTFARGRKLRADRGHSFFRQSDWDLAEVLQEIIIEKKQECDQVCTAARVQRQSATKQRKSAKNALKREKDLERCEREDLDQRLRTMRANEEFLRLQLLEDCAKECLHAVAITKEKEVDKTFQVQQQAHANLLRSKRVRAEKERDVLTDKLRIAVTLRTVVYPQVDQTFWQAACVRAIKESSNDINDIGFLWEAVQEYDAFTKAISHRNFTDFQPVQSGEYCEVLFVRQACKLVLQRAFLMSSSAPCIPVGEFVLSLVQEMEWYLQSIMRILPQVQTIPVHRKCDNFVKFVLAHVLRFVSAVLPLLSAGMRTLLDYYDDMLLIEFGSGINCCTLFSKLGKKKSARILPAKPQTKLFGVCDSSISARKLPEALSVVYNGLLQGFGKGTTTRAQSARSGGRSTAAPVSKTTVAKTASTPTQSSPATFAEKTKRAAALKSVRTKLTTPLRKATRGTSKPKGASLLKPPDRLKPTARKYGKKNAATSSSESESVQDIVLTSEGTSDSSAGYSVPSKMRKLTTRKDLRRKTTFLSRSPERTATKSKLKNRKLSKVAARKLKERRVLRSERMQHKQSALTGSGSEDSSDAAHTSHSSSNDSSTSYSSSDSEEIASSSENTPKRARGKKLKRARSTSSHELRSGKRARHNQDVNNMFTAFSAHAKGAKLESFRWTEARAASCLTPASLHTAKSNHLADLTSLVPTFGPATDKAKLKMFLSILGNTDRVLISNFVSTRPNATWKQVRDKWIFPTGKTASIADLRTESMRKQTSTETAAEWISSLFGAKRGLRRVDKDERAKTHVTSNNELYESVKEGFNWQNKIPTEQVVTKKMHAWLVERGLKHGKAKPTYDEMVDKANHLKHLAVENERVSKPLAAHPSIAPQRLQPPAYNAIKSTLEAQGQQPEEEVETQTQSSTKVTNVQRVYRNKGDGKKSDKPNKLAQANAPRHRNRKPSPSPSSSSDSSSESEEPERKEVQIRKRKLRKSGNAFKQSNTVTALSTQQNQPQGRVTIVNQRNANFPPRKPGFCRHCGKILQAHETYNTHQCQQKIDKIFYCNGCKGPMRNVSTLPQYYLHLHSCSNVICKKCNVNTHAYFSCPELLCEACNAYGHFKWLHPYMEGDSGKDLKAMLMKSTTAPKAIIQRYSKTVTFKAPQVTSSDDDDSKSLLRGTGDRSRIPRWRRHEEPMDNPPYFDPTFSPISMEETDTDGEPVPQYSSDSTANSDTDDSIDYYPGPTDTYNMSNNLGQTRPDSPMSADLRKELGMLPERLPSLLYETKEYMRQKRRRESKSSSTSNSQSSSSTSSSVRLPPAVIAKEENVSICEDVMAPYFKPTEDGKKLIEECLQIENLLISILSSNNILNRLDFENLRHVNRRLRILLDLHMAKLVRAAKNECGRVWDLSPINFPRDLPEIKRMIPPYLCYACAFVMPSRCVRHGTCVTTHSEELRFQFVVQKPALPVRNNNEALYRELDTMVLWGSRSSRETKRLRKLIAYMLNNYEGDSKVHQHRTRELLQNLTWDYYEVNTIAKNTLRLFGGGKRNSFNTVSSRMHFRNGEDFYKLFNHTMRQTALGVPFVSIEFHRIHAFENLHQDLFRKHIAAAYDRLRKELGRTVRSHLKETYMPPDLHRNIPGDGMVSTWIMYQALTLFKANPTDPVSAYLLMRNQTWSQEMATKQDTDSREICEHLKWKIHVPNTHIPVDGYRQIAASPALQEFLDSNWLGELPCVSASTCPNFEHRVSQFQNQFVLRKNQREVVARAHTVMLQLARNANTPTAAVVIPLPAPVLPDVYYGERKENHAMNIHDFRTTMRDNNLKQMKAQQSLRLKNQTERREQAESQAANAALPNVSLPEFRQPMVRQIMGEYLPQHLRLPELYAAHAAAESAVTVPYMESSLLGVISRTTLIRQPPLQVERNMLQVQHELFAQREREESEQIAVLAQLDTTLDVRAIFPPVPEDEQLENVSDLPTLLKGTGKRRRSDPTTTTPKHTREAPSPKPDPVQHVSLVWFTILINGWESTLVWLVKKTFDIGHLDSHRVLFLRANQEIHFSLQDLASELQNCHSTDVESEQSCSKCSIYPWSSLFDGNRCTFCNMGYVILQATVDDNEMLTLTDTRGGVHRHNLRDINMEMCTPHTCIVSPMYKSVLKDQLNKAMRRIKTNKELANTPLIARKQKGMTLFMSLISAPTQVVNSKSAPNEGLDNKCQTICWANSILQLLATCTNLTDSISEDNLNDNAVLRILQEILQLLGGYVPVDTSRRDLDRQVQDRSAYLQLSLLKPRNGNLPGHQQDADEGYRLIMNFLSTNATTAYKMFVGRESVTSKCLKCMTTFEKEHEFTPPFVPMKQSSTPFDLQARLFKLTRPREESAENECVCCKTKTSRTVNTKVESFPKYCLLHLQRGRRDNVKVTTPLSNAFETFVIDNTEFHLSAIIAHIGEEANSGHFVAYTMASTIDVFKFNDHIVTRQKLADIDTSSIATLLYETRASPTTVPTPSITQNGSSFRDGTREVQSQTTGKNGVVESTPQNEDLTNAAASRNNVVSHSETTPSTLKASNSAADESAEGAKYQLWVESSKLNEATDFQEMQKKANALTTEIETCMNSAKCDRHICEHYTNEDSKTPQFEGTLHSEPLPEHSRILNWNVRSLNNVMTKAHICPWEVTNFDLIILTETQSGLTKLSKHKAFPRVFRNFKFAFWSACTLQVKGVINMGQAGVGVVCKNRPISVQWGFPNETSEHNTGRVLVVRWLNCTLVAVYAPANLKDGTDLVRDFFKQLQLLVCKERARAYTFVAGDLNIPLTPKDVSPVQSWLLGETRVYAADQEVFHDFLSNCELRDASAKLAGKFTWFPEPTRNSQINNIGMRLDYVLLPVSSQVLCCAILENLAVSDHRPVLLEFNMKKCATNITHSKYVEKLFNATLESKQVHACDVQLTAIREIVERFHSIENCDFQANTVESAATLVRNFETVDGVKQPEFGKVVLATNIEETVNEAVAYDEFVLERDLTEREMVFNAMRAYCKVQGERKKSNDLPPPRVALYVSGAFAVHYALVDTGSTLCLCDAQLIHKLLKESASLRAAHHLVPLKNFKLQLGDGNTNMSVVGKMLIPFHLKTSEGKEVAIQQWFYMTTGLPDCWVIGDSLFKDQRIHKADISQHYRTLSFNKHVVPYVEMEPHFHCYMETEEVIPANATIVCLLRAANSTMKKRYVGVLSDRIDHQKLSILENVTRIWEKGHVRVSIYNKSKRTVTLKKGQSVACFQVTENLPDVDDEKLRTFTEQTENEKDDVFKVFARQHTELPSSSIIVPPELAQSKLRSSASDSIRITEVECARKAVQSNAIMGHNTKVVLKHIPIFEESERCSSFSPEVDASDPVKILRSTVDDADNISFNAYATNVVLAAMDSKSKERITTPSIVASELRVDNDLSGPEAVTADAATSHGEIPTPACVDRIADDKVSRPSLRMPGDLLQEGVGLATILSSSDWKTGLPEGIIDEILSLPCALDLKDVPDFFEGDALTEKNLPTYLHGWKVNLKDLSISKDDFNRFILEALILPEGREDLFRETEPGCVRDYEAVIELIDNSPWYARLRPGHNTDKAEFKVVLDRYVSQKLVRKVENAPCTSSAMMVQKKGGRNQLAFIYSRLNTQTKPCLWPLPLLGDCLDSLGLARFLTSIDINGAYHSIPVAQESQQWLTFLCHFGLYTWMRLPYGYKNSGPIFCSVVFETLAGLVYEILTLYVDDIKMFGGVTVNAHIKCIILVLNRLQKRGFRVSVKKCHFFVIEMDHLGVNCYGTGTRPTRSNVTKITNITVENVRDVRGFLASTNYYRRFIKSYAQIVSPLLVYLRKDAKLPNVLPNDVVQAITKVKEALTTFPILRNPDFTKQFILECDASKQGFGAVLKQLVEGVEIVCSYASSHISSGMLKYTPDMLELIGAVWSMEHFSHYLRKKKFILKTDNVILKWLRGSLSSTTKTAFIKWVLMAQVYDFEVVHVPGPRLVMGDLLSRAGARNAPVDVMLDEMESAEYSRYGDALTNEQFITTELDGACYYKQSELRAGVERIDKADEKSARVLKNRFVFEDLNRERWIKEQTSDRRLTRALKSTSANAFVKVNGLWFKKARRDNLRVVVPDSLRATLMTIAHTFLGHRGVKPIVKYVSKRLYWPGVWVYARSWVLSCSDCRRRKMPRKVQAWLGRVRQIEVPWYCLSIDFILQFLPKTAEGFTYCITVMCVFIRYTIAIPLKTKDPRELAMALFKEVFSIFGFPVVVLSDNDTTLVNESMALVFKRFGVRRTLTLWRRPQSNGHLERFHRYVNETMAIILPRYDEWPDMLPVMMFAFRNMAQETTGFSPHYLNFGRDALMPLDVSWCTGSDNKLFKPQPEGSAPNSFVNSLIARLQAAFKMVRQAQIKASEANKIRALQKLSSRTNVQHIRFEPGDLVYLREETSVSGKDGAMRVTLPSPQQFVPRKWCFKWSGPHKVVAALGVRAYTVFHMQRKKELKVSVDDLQLHIPFSDELFDTARAAPMVRQRDLPPPEGCNSLFRDNEGSECPSVGDFVITRRPDFEEQEFCVLKKIDATHYQWHSSQNMNRLSLLKKDLDPFKTLAYTRWYPGWWNESQKRVTYEYDQPPNSVEYLADDEELPNGFLVWGFTLNKSCRVSQQLCTWVKAYCDPANNTSLPM